MQRRLRVDLGQQALGKKDEEKLARKRSRWAARNKDRSEENPFVAAIKPHLDQYGEQDETSEQLRSRLMNLEFGNFPGYFNYRNKSAADQKEEREALTNQEAQSKTEASSHTTTESTPKEQLEIEAGLSDERLQHLDREWFCGKEVLDIGCNRGHITYAIARMFSPKFIIGIDIDEKMVSMANKDLHLHLQSGIIDTSIALRRERAASQKLKPSNQGAGDPGIDYLEDSDHYLLASYINSGPIISTPQAHSADSPEPIRNQFPKNLLFLEHNYVLARDELVEKQKPFFDVIVCLSVTKWVHLNYRDDGLKRLFKRTFQHLRHGGLFILEAQPFDNYSRRKRLSDRLKANFYSIRFKPDDFDKYLLSPEVGYKEIIYNSVTDHRCLGFKRPLKVYRK